ncbi:MAG: 16S rRNA (guanine(527)-N(7))-methyltransferase RsmG [Alphaproteobacteria bacterium]
MVGLANVSRETSARLTRYVALLRSWQKAQNLVAGGTLDDVWQRHLGDSAQLASLFPDARVWVDLGTGGGFPGMVLAILAAERAAGEVHMIESNRRKCAFLRQVLRETGAAGVVHDGRIEQCLPTIQDEVDRITARALAPLPKLLELAYPMLQRGVPAAFLKGRDFVLEIDESSKSWEFDLVVHESRVAGGGVILDLSNVRRRSSHG